MHTEILSRKQRVLTIIVVGSSVLLLNTRVYIITQIKLPYSGLISTTSSSSTVVQL